MAELKTQVNDADVNKFIDSVADEHEELLTKLGNVKTGKSCLYVKRLEDIDRRVLAQLIRASVAHMRRTYPTK